MSEWAEKKLRQVFEPWRREYGETSLGLFQVHASKPSEKKLAKRHLAVGNRRLVLMKKPTKLTKLVTKVIHFYDVKRVECSTADSATITYHTAKGEKTLALRTSDLPHIVQLVRQCYDEITPGFSSTVLMKLTLWPGADLEPSPAPQERSLASPIQRVYVAQCGYFGEPVSREFAHFLEDAVHSGGRELNFCECPGIGHKTPIAFGMRPVIATLRHASQFDSLVLANLHSKEVVAHMANILRHNTHLKRVVLAGMETSKAFVLLGDLIAANRKHAIHSLTLSGSKIPNDGIDAIANALELFPHGLSELDLSHCQLSGLRADALVTSFERNYAVSLGIQTLDLSHNNFDLSGSQALERWLHNVKENSQLRVLNLSHSNVNMTAVCRSLSSLRFLEELDISFNKMDLGASQLLCVAAEKSTTLRSLAAQGCEFTGENMQAILRAVLSNASIPPVHMDLSHNLLASKEVPGVCHVLRTGATLRSLSLAGMKLKPEPFRELMKALRRTTALDTLVLDRGYCNAKDDRVAVALAGLLECVPAIATLSLRGGFGAVMVRLLPLLQSNTTLLELDVSENGFGDEGATAVATMLRQNRALGRLDLDGNAIQLSGWKSIRLAFRYNRTLVCLPYPWQDLDAITRKEKEESGTVAHVRRLLAEIETAVSLNANEACDGRVWRTMPDRKKPLEERLWDELIPLPGSVPELLPVPPHLLQLQQEARLTKVAMPLEAIHGPSYPAAASVSMDGDLTPARQAPATPASPAMTPQRPPPARPPPPSSLPAGFAPARPPPPRPESIMAATSVPLSASSHTLPVPLPPRPGQAPPRPPAPSSSYAQPPLPPASMNPRRAPPPSPQ